ncbi:gluconate 2-dehydrogenase subunit 3 family protein [Paenibacillus sp. GCM10023248]|uniref:gluconate 2-dehydrogenase subunit 3 family protein n=1 Tax=unclassified Paenibacillus TaxID=185978 RepID=UPI002379BF74|nr:gluconate 2-dehydrogenase subunit 3 family protein [Paenibacillus sp. MAHUQ-63]MDD9270865.1 gluconate 2-dehydrogenase subunit 3 family protein [Paenibacillus sp. MAHUQ-63]
MTNQSHYPSYNVMDEQNEWDAHTRSIVNARLLRENHYRYITPLEAETLRAWCSLLMDDSRGDIIGYVLSHIDDVLAKGQGEGNREKNVPEIRTLVRNGLEAIDETGWIHSSKPFFELDSANKRLIMQQIASNEYPNTEKWDGVPQKALFQKLLQLSIEAYYSHPLIWSEIGYGGPAYPRGYFRADLGHLDPWEAVKEP